MIYIFYVNLVLKLSLYMCCNKLQTFEIISCVLAALGASVGIVFNFNFQCRAEILLNTYIYIYIYIAYQKDRLKHVRCETIFTDNYSQRYASLQVQISHLLWRPYHVNPKFNSTNSSYISCTSTLRLLQGTIFRVYYYQYPLRDNLDTKRKVTHWHLNFLWENAINQLLFLWVFVLVNQMQIWQYTPPEWVYAL